MESTDPIDFSANASSETSDDSDQESNKNSPEDNSPFSTDYPDPDQHYKERLEKHFSLQTHVYYDDEISRYRRRVPYTIHLIDDKNALVTTDQDGNTIYAELILDPNDYQPRFEIRVGRQRDEEEAAEDDGLDPTNPTAGRSNQRICARYPFATQDQCLCDYEKSVEHEDDGLGVQVIDVKERANAGHQARTFFRSMSPETAAKIDEMAPDDVQHAFFCVIIHREEGILDTRVFENVPEWAQQIAPILTNRETRFIIEGVAETAEAIETFEEYLQKKQYPYQAFHDRDRKGSMRFIKDKMLSPGIVKLKPQDYDFHPLYQFQNIFEYATLAYVTAGETSRILEKVSFALNDGIHELRLMLMPGTQDDSTYLGYLRFERSDREGVDVYAPRIGDKLDVSFDLNESWSTKQADRPRGIWQAKICRTVSVNPPRGWYPCLVKRPWDRKTEKFDSYEPEVTNILSQFDGNFNATILKVAAQKIRARVVFDNKVLSNVKWSVDNLIHASERHPFTTFNKRMNKVLLGTRLDLLDVVNFFQGPSEELGSDLLQYMNLDKHQAIAFTLATRSMGGISLLQGHSGTGKSHVPIEFATAFLLCRNSPQQMLIASPHNSTADDIAIAIQAKVTMLSKDHPHVASKYVIREYSEASDRQYRDILITKARTATLGIEDSKVSRPDTSVSDIDDPLDRLPDLTQSVIDLIEEALVCPTAGVMDTRFTLPEFSTGGRMLESVGLNPDLADWPRFRKRHGKFVKYYQIWKRGGFLSKMQMKEFGERGDRLRIDVLRNAFAIVGTTAGIASPRLIQAVEPVTTAIILEDNTHEAEQNIVPIMAARFLKDPKILLIGDHHQLRPRAPVVPTELVLAKQVEVAFMSRMIAVGHYSHVLTTNYRMAPDISEPVNRIIYGGKLVDHESVSSEFRPLQRAFARYINEKFDKGYANAFFIDTASGGKNQTTVNRLTKSRSNEFHVNIVLTLVIELLEMLPPVAEASGAGDAGSANPNPSKKEERVAILTMYEDQKNLYMQAMSSMRTGGVTNIDRLDILNTDGAQGKEYAFQVNDLALSEDPGFVADPRRLNVSQTRAKYGLINVGNAGLIERIKGVQTLKLFKHHYVEKGKMYTVNSDKWITTPYFNPQGITKATAKAGPRRAAALDLGLPVSLSAVKKHLGPGSTIYPPLHRLLLQQLSLTDPKPVNNNVTGFSEIVAPGAGNLY